MGKWDYFPGGYLEQHVLLILWYKWSTNRMKIVLYIEEINFSI